MKGNLILMFVSLFILSACSNGQIYPKKSVKKDSLFKPETNVKVNKEYDDEGNLIRYDSTYTSFYSNIEKNNTLADSIFNNFKLDFKSQFPFSDKSYFNDLFFIDSLLKYDFYKHDFFNQRFNMNRSGIEDLFREMDSIKNKYYKKMENL